MHTSKELFTSACVDQLLYIAYFIYHPSCRIQWGTGTDNYNVVFPVQFVAEVFALAGIVQEDYNGGRDVMTYANLTTAGFLMIINTSYPAKYIAIGR